VKVKVQASGVGGILNLNVSGKNQFSYNSNPEFNHSAWNTLLVTGASPSSADLKFNGLTAVLLMTSVV